MTCRECGLTVTITDRRLRVVDHEIVWRTVAPGVEVPHFFFHNPG